MMALPIKVRHHHHIATQQIAFAACARPSRTLVLQGNLDHNAMIEKGFVGLDRPTAGTPIRAKRLWHGTNLVQCPGTAQG